MISATKPAEMRKHPRAQVNLPARIRWRGPLGMRVEAARTLDMARDGIRVHRNEPCETGSRVWVACPFDPNSASGAPPETPAHVVRVEPAENLPGPAPRADLRAGVSAMLTSVAIRWDLPTKT